MKLSELLAFSKFYRLIYIEVTDNCETASMKLSLFLVGMNINFCVVEDLEAIIYNFRLIWSCEFIISVLETCFYLCVKVEDTSFAY